MKNLTTADKLKTIAKLINEVYNETEKDEFISFNNKIWDILNPMCEVHNKVKLEALKENRSGQYIIRINGQWRICFHWENGDVTDVEIVDYHA